MNHQRVYDSLIEKARPRGLNKKKIGFYTETHHILPRCIGGVDDKSNLVLLSAREHAIAHVLLAKIHPDNYGLVQAGISMAGKSGRINTRLHAKLREAARDVIKAKSKEIYANGISDIHRENLSKASRKTKSKAVVQYSLSGEYIAEFETGLDAAISIGKPLSSGNIYLCCKGGLRKAYGFVWQYK